MIEGWGWIGETTPITCIFQREELVRIGALTQTEERCRE